LAFLLLVEGERCFFLGAWLVVSPVFSTGFPALIHTSFTDTAVELKLLSIAFQSIHPIKILVIDHQHQHMKHVAGEGPAKRRN
jgi:hypothetical protein